jgi:hypothetical protein
LQGPYEQLTWQAPRQVMSQELTIAQLALLPSPIVAVQLITF